MHSFGFYVHNDTMRALGRPQDMFSEKGNSITTYFLHSGFKISFISSWNNCSKQQQVMRLVEKL
jgi:hypothetical protein